MCGIVPEILFQHEAYLGISIRHVK